jgi:hypothetical protein
MNYLALMLFVMTSQLSSYSMSSSSLFSVNSDSNSQPTTDRSTYKYIDSLRERTLDGIPDTENITCIPTNLHDISAQLDLGNEALAYNYTENSTLIQEFLTHFDPLVLNGTMTMDEARMDIVGRKWRYNVSVEEFVLRGLKRLSLAPVKIVGDFGLRLEGKMNDLNVRLFQYLHPLLSKFVS